MRIEWRPGYHGKIDPKTAWKEVDKIRKKNGGQVHPEDVVNAAKPKSNPLHPQIYHLGDGEAAHAWRMQEARKMLHSLHIISEKPEEQPRRVLELKRTEATATKPARNVYATMEDIMADPEARAELLARALRELIAFRNRYKQLQELAIVMRATEEVLSSVEV